MKEAQVIKMFRDKESSKLYAEGEKIKLSEERISELSAKGYVEAKEETPKPEKVKPAGKGEKSKPETKEEKSFE